MYMSKHYIITVFAILFFQSSTINRRDAKKTKFEKDHNTLKLVTLRLMVTVLCNDAC